MNIPQIRDEQDYQKALERLEVILDAKKGTEEGEELDILSILIDQYENEKFSIEIPENFNYRIEKSLKDSRDGRLTEVNDLLSEIKKWS